MASSELKDCSICQEAFDEDARKPLIFPCFHTFCKHCIDGLIQYENLQCPVCRGNFQANSSGDLPVNQGMLDMIIYMKQMEGKLLEAVRSYEGWPFPQREDKALWQKTKAEMDKLIEIDETLIKEIKNVNTVAKGIIEENEKLVEDLTEHKDKLQKQIEDFIKKCKGIRDAENEIGKTKSPVVWSVIVESSNITKDLQKTVDDTELIMDGNRALLKIIEENNKESLQKLSCLKDIQHSLKNFYDESTLLGHPDSGAVARKDETLEYMTMEEIRKSTTEFYVVTSVNGKNKFTRVIKDGTKLYVPSPKGEQVIPSTTMFVKNEDFQPLLGYSNSRYPQAYMDLSINGKLLGRILIEYIHSDFYSCDIENHIKLCSGELGPSFANSNVLEVTRKNYGKDVDLILFGDYEKNDGTGGKAVVSGAGGNWHRGGREEEIDHALCPKYSSKKTASHFGIMRSSKHYFGRVTQGYNILVTAVQKHDPKEIKISDCGLIVSL